MKTVPVLNTLLMRMNNSICEKLKNIHTNGTEQSTKILKYDFVFTIFNCSIPIIIYNSITSLI